MLFCEASWHLKTGTKMKRGQLAWIDSPFFSADSAIAASLHLAPPVERWNLTAVDPTQELRNLLLRHQGLVTVLRGSRKPWDLQLTSQPFAAMLHQIKANEHCDETLGATRPIERRDSPHLGNIKQHRFGGKLALALFEPSGNPPRYRKHRFVYDERHNS